MTRTIAGERKPFCQAKRRAVPFGLAVIVCLSLTVSPSFAQTRTTVPGTSGLNSPQGIAVDPAGNIYIADSNNHRIRKVTPDGISTVVAGGGDFELHFGLHATLVPLSNPLAVAVDTAGRLYIADTFHDQVLILDTSGRIQSFVGTGTRGFSGDGGPADEAQLDRPNALAVDADGNLYISGLGNKRVRRVDPSGTITTYAGTGNESHSGDDGPATQASFYTPRGLAADGEGNLYISESDDSGSNGYVRKVSPNGIITTVAGTGLSGFSGDGGRATSARLFFPRGLATDAHGTLYIADYRNDRIRRVSPSGFITTVAGPDTTASLFRPAGVAVDADGNLLVAATAVYKVAGIPNIFIQTVTPPSVTLVPGNSAIVTITLERNNYTGPIGLQISAVPAGFGSRIESSAGGDSWTVTLLTLRTVRPVTDWEVTITATGEGFSPVIGSFSITVEALVPTLQVEPTSLSFTGVAGGANPASQTVTVSDGTGGTVAWTASITAGGNWLDISPSSGTNATPLTVSVNLSGLPPETYSGTIEVAASSLSGSPQAVPVTFVVDPVPPDWPQVSSGGIVNNASYTLASASVAPGAIVAIFGINLTDGGSCVPPDCSATFGSEGRLNTLMSGAEVKVNGTPVPLFYASPMQLGVQMPTELTGASAEVVVSVGDHTSLSQTVLIEPVSPGIFTFSADGRGAGGITHVDGSSVNPQSPARAGELVILYATGLGPVTPPVATGALPTGEARSVAATEVIIDGMRVTPDFAGLTGCCVGLNQVNFRIPESTRSADNIPLVLEIGGKQSNSVDIAVQ